MLSGQYHPDLSAQLDLWTNLAFDCDEAPNFDDEKYRGRSRNDEEEEDLITSHGSGTGEAAIHDGHINVVTGTNVGPNLGREAQIQQQAPGFDLNTFLAGLGSTPFPPAVPVPPNALVPSLAQLIAQYTALGAPAFPATFNRAPGTQSNPHLVDPSSAPAAKRARTRKSSVSTRAESPEDGPGEDVPGVGVSSSEDKRRRNTAASARFRLKKKEREAALEGKAKELEGRVNELERECEGLRRENGWLKGLVVGVTGAAQGPVSAGTKRSVDEVESA